MKKYLLAMAMAVAASFSANASYIQGVTGAELDGIQVTVEFENGGIESATWEATSATGGGAWGDSDWFVVEDGDTFGDYDSATGTYYGLFTFVSFAFDVVSIKLDMLGSDLVFDSEFFDVSGNGSGPGRALVVDFPQNVNYNVAYDNGVEDELFQTVTITGDFLALVEYGFLTDIDAMASEVPAPTGLALLGLGLVAMRLARRK
ncbi:hypothetical protein [Alteromonas lipolytica]|uniref:PEP-CTERM protein-sorting domain-containing protein n=1 Tax=Alteromonas lipolytica TaxID=1856405 RepID=A0A1E8FD44_9ALTE|nr:hypothetical protein [Alteromonas lipolytica]OFI33855.1 hypothetical protein BFC17_20005 [Alteromonas lipolytica]GGF67800.1 hypothetical protein GCM10011338_20000 [Alteromonas lipolytica]